MPFQTYNILIYRKLCCDKNAYCNKTEHRAFGFEGIAHKVFGFPAVRSFQTTDNYAWRLCLHYLPKPAKLIKHKSRPIFESWIFIYLYY